MPGKPYSAAEVETVKRRAAEGWTNAAIAKEIGRTPTALDRWRTENDIRINVAARRKARSAERAAAT